MEPNQTIVSSNEGTSIQWTGYLTVPFIKEWYDLANHWDFPKGKRTKLDLNGIERIDSAGIQFLIFIKKEATPNTKCWNSPITLYLF